MTDNWRDLPAGDALDRIVAERLGWTRVDETGDFYEVPYTSEFVPVLEGTNSDGERQRLPFYSHHAAAPLPLSAREWFCIYEYADRFEASVEGRDIGTDHDAEHGDTLALARLRAWLAHDDAKLKGKDGER